MRLGSAAVLFLVLGTPLPAQIGEDAAASKLLVSAEFQPPKARPGAEVTLAIKVTVVPGWHVYGSGEKTGQPIRFELTKAGPLKSPGPIEVPLGEAKTVGDLTSFELHGSFELTQRLQWPEGSPAESVDVAGTVHFMVCDEQTCLPPSQIDFSATLAVDSGFWALLLAALSSWSTLLLASIGAGLFTLVMPCTYPMIPITISFFTKQADARGGSVLPLALAYGAGIVLIFVLIGIVVGPAIVVFATNPWTNLVIGVVFVIFALSLFGVITLQPPQFLLNAAGKASAQGGYLGVFLMGATLVITSFTCTAPFVGSLLAVTGSSFRDLIVGMAVFGATVALPFVWLATVPGRVRSLPRAGEWMHLLKVYLGFVELAAALKFFSNADVVWKWQALSRELFLLLWFGIFLLAGLLLLGAIRLEGDGNTGIGPKRLTAALATILFSLYCLFGALGFRLDEAVMTPLAPPYSAQSVLVSSVAGAAANGSGTQIGNGAPNENSGKASARVAGPHVIVVDDYERALAVALEQKKLVLVNFTGLT
jgi:thiol:disulfide interchange protein DsbD